jgi:hypothetical protein
MSLPSSGLKGMQKKKKIGVKQAANLEVEDDMCLWNGDWLLSYRVLYLRRQNSLFIYRSVIYFTALLTLSMSGDSSVGRVAKLQAG